MSAEVYPIFLHQMNGARVVVVGGGAVGERKIQGLLAVGAHVTLIAPQATLPLQAYAAEGKIAWIQRGFQSGDLENAVLAFAATDQRTVNQQVAAEAKQQHTLCNVADCAEEGDFHLPALHRTGDLTIAVGSRGRDVHAAKRMRDRIVQFVLSCV